MNEPSFNEPEYLLGIETVMSRIVVSAGSRCFNEPEYLLGIETLLKESRIISSAGFNEPEYLLGIETIIIT